MVGEVCTRGRAGLAIGGLAVLLASSTVAQAQIPGTPSDADVVMFAKNATRVQGNWQVVPDTTAAAGARLWNPDAGVGKLPSALSAPVSYFELTFNADANRGYRLWLRGRADRDSWANDSVYVQFSDSVSSTGAPTARIGTTSATWVGIEDCSGCGLQGWGWQDNGYGTGVLGPLVYFSQAGSHTIRIQQREDGVSIDQIVLSPVSHLTQAPGATKNDTTILMPPPVELQGPVRIRVLQWNLHHGVGSDGVYNLNRIATAMAALNPDVVLLNEVEKYTGWGNEDQPERYRAMLEAKTGKRWYSLFAQEYGNWTGNGKGNEILSTFPFTAIDRTTLSYERTIAEAAITVNGKVITLMQTHLDPDSYDVRLLQAKQAVSWASARLENRIIGGDFNAWPDQTSIAEMGKSYVDSWDAAARAGKAVSFSGNSPFGATKKGRIDYIFYSRTAANLVVVQSQVYDLRDAAGVMPSDHRPVVTTFDVQ